MLWNVVSCRMTEGSLPQPSGAGQERADASSPEPTTPDQDANVADPHQPSTTVKEPAKSKTGRSNEFWLGLVGVAATAIVGLTGTFMSYRSSVSQMNSQASQATLEFTRNQRQAAYTQFLVADTDLGEKEYRLAASLSVKNLGDRDKIQQFKVDWFAATVKFGQADTSVLLAASEGVAAAAGALADYHRDLQKPIGALLDDYDVGKFTAAADDLIARLDYNDLRQRFIDAAKSELGFS
jgi:hypothetical protein